MAGVSATASYRFAAGKALDGVIGNALTLPTTQGGPGATNVQAIAESSFIAGRRRILIPVTDAGTAATVMLETACFWAESWLTGTSSGSGSIAVSAVEFLPQLTVAVAASNYYTLTLAARVSGAAGTTIATITSNTGGTATTAFVPVAMTSTNLPYILNAGTDVLTIALTKTGSGAAITGSTGFAYVAITIDEL